MESKNSFPHPQPLSITWVLNFNMAFQKCVLYLHGQG